MCFAIGGVACGITFTAALLFIIFAFLLYGLSIIAKHAV
jgi:hypothetical protein